MIRSRHGSRYFKKRMEWIGHVVRMNHEGAVKKFDSKMGGSRTRGRPEMAGRCGERYIGDEG
jgi:hypothetical protein